MNVNQELLSEAIYTVLADYAGTKEFVLDQAPEAIKQLITWKVWECSIAVVFFLLLTLSFFLLRWYILMKLDDHDQGPYVCSWIAVVGLSFLPVCGAVSYFHELLEIYLAPKVWLLEYASGLLS